MDSEDANDTGSWSWVSLESSCIIVSGKKTIAHDNDHFSDPTKSEDGHDAWCGLKI